ncbi:hypothetical protein TNCV_2028321 [Trichonephila clavipes]|nr:hypothetical protein TNCV_2028321 [Trichonephila clavipes]
MADLLPRNRVFQIQHRSEETPAKSFLVCVRLRQRSLLLLTGLFTHKFLRDEVGTNNKYSTCVEVGTHRRKFRLCVGKPIDENPACVEVGTNSV